MDWFVATLLGALFFGTGGFLMRISNQMEQAPRVILTGLYITGTAAFLIHAINTQSLIVTLPYVLIGIAIGLGSVWGNVFFIRSFEYGPTSLTGVIINTNVVFVALMSVLLFDELLEIKDVIAVIMLIVSVSLLAFDPNEDLAIRDRRWYIVTILAMVCFFARTGGLKITDEFSYNNTAILIYAYIAGLGWALFGMARQPFLQAFRTQPRIWWAFAGGLLAGLCSFGGIQLYAVAIETGPASIIAPVFATNALVLTLWVVIVLGERLSRHQVFAFIGIMSALILIRV